MVYKKARRLALEEAKHRARRERETAQLAALESLNRSMAAMAKMIRAKHVRTSAEAAKALNNEKQARFFIDRATQMDEEVYDLFNISSSFCILREILVCITMSSSSEHLIFPT